MPPSPKSAEPLTAANMANVKRAVPIVSRCSCGWKLPQNVYVQAPTMMSLPETGLVRVQCPECKQLHLASWLPAPAAGSP